MNTASLTNHLQTHCHCLSMSATRWSLAHPKRYRPSSLGSSNHLLLLTMSFLQLPMKNTCLCISLATATASNKCSLMACHSQAEPLLKDLLTRTNLRKLLYTMMAPRSSTTLPKVGLYKIPLPIPETIMMKATTRYSVKLSSALRRTGKSPAPSTILTPSNNSRVRTRPLLLR